MPATDFPFGYNLPTPASFRNYTADDVFYGMSGPSPEVTYVKMAYNKVMNTYTATLRIPWYKVKEEPCPLALPQ